MILLSDNRMESHSGDFDDSRKLLILFATETGNAQDSADYIARQCRRIAFNCRVVSMDAYPPHDLISEDLVVFVVSTTGSGVEPRSMTELWTMLLRSDLPNDLFEDLPFAVFGLGDTSYEKFCWAAKKLSRRMESLGGFEICERGDGDEQHRFGIDEVLHPWTEKLLKALLELFPLPTGAKVGSGDVVPPPRVIIRNEPAYNDEQVTDPLDEDEKYHTVTVKKNVRITAADWYQDVRHIELDLGDENLVYNPGDVAIIHPISSTLEVESFLTMMGWGNIADQGITIERSQLDQSLPDHLPSRSTLRTIFTRYLDFNAVPRRSFFRYIRHFTTDAAEREKLDEFLSLEGADDLYDYCHRVRRTIQEILAEFRHVRIPQDYIFDVFPPLRPRHFSIASSIKRHPKQLHLCVAIVKYRTKLKMPRRGVCTSYLSSIQPGESIRIGILQGLIKLPPDHKTPIICVAPGTGLAPMRSVIEERIHHGSQSNTLYFGCRSATQDQHYGTEWTSYASSRDIVYRTAFSRDQPEGTKRIYVQDRIRSDAERIWKIIGEEKGWVYISGSSNKMPLAVKEAIAYSVELHGGYSSEEAKHYVDAMVKDGRLIEECWS